MLVPALVLAISAPAAAQDNTEYFLSPDLGEVAAPAAIDPLQHHTSLTVTVQSTKAATDPFGANPVMSVIAAASTSGKAPNPLTHR
jgi:hypothetical protein